MNDGPEGLGQAVLAAAALEDAEREDYLRHLAAADPALAAEVRRRLAAAEDLSDSFLSTPAAERLAGDGTDETAPDALAPAGDRYELGETLGEGGMGRVVLAFDRRLGRTVALKLLHHQDPAIVRLFLGEARAQARVHHDHVLEVYDSGDLEGQPFIAMRHVAGGTLAEIGPGLALEQKVRLLAQVAEGLHAAHREGLLHRDVKPGNVLVERTADGDLKALVADFGLATEMDGADAAAAGPLAGSPHFIAPERLAGSGSAADRRSDVYSLGVTMYWLLAGGLPFSGANTFDVLSRTLSDDLPPPRRILPSLPVELEAIILRATARDPGQRYASARAVAADLSRYLDGEVVEAYAAGLAYRLTRFVLRNKLLAGIAAAAAVLLLAASVAIAVFALRADAARERAELRQGQAEELIRFLVADLYKPLESLGRLDVLDSVGDAAAKYFAAVPAEQLSEAELLRRSQTLYQIGDVRIRQGDLAGAATPMEQSLALARRLAELAPGDGERLFALGQSQYWAGYVHWQKGDLERARRPFEEYLATSRKLVELEFGNLKWRRELSYAHSNLGSLQQAEGDLEAALAQFLATLAIDRELVAAEPANADAQAELAATHNTAGVVLQDLGRLREAGGHLRAEFDLRKKLLAADPKDFKRRDFFATSHSRLGIHLSLLGDWPAAAGHFAAAREIFAALVAHDPDNAAWKFKLAWSHLHLGRAAHARGDLGEAERSLAAQRRLIDDLLGQATPPAWRRTRAIGLYQLALVKRARGQDARADLESAVEILADLAKARRPDPDAIRCLSLCHLLLGSLAPSPAAGRAEFERAEKVVAPLARGSRDGRMLAPWTAALRCLGRSAEARAAESALRASGFVEPGLSGLCASPSEPAA